MAQPSYLSLAESKTSGLEYPIVAPRATIRVLLDDVDARHVAKDALTAARATVVAVSSAQEALEVLGRATFDALLLDIGMPEVDGYQLLARIRQSADEPAAVDRVRALYRSHPIAEGRVSDAFIQTGAARGTCHRCTGADRNLHGASSAQPDDVTSSATSLIGRDAR